MTAADLPHPPTDRALVVVINALYETGHTTLSEMAEAVVAALVAANLLAVEAALASGDQPTSEGGEREPGWCESCGGPCRDESVEYPAPAEPVGEPEPERCETCDALAGIDDLGFPMPCPDPFHRPAPSDVPADLCGHEYRTEDYGTLSCDMPAAHEGEHGADVPEAGSTAHIRWPDVPADPPAAAERFVPKAGEQYVSDTGEVTMAADDHGPDYCGDVLGDVACQGHPRPPADPPAVPRGIPRATLTWPGCSFFVTGEHAVDVAARDTTICAGCGAKAPIKGQPPADPVAEGEPEREVGLPFARMADDRPCGWMEMDFTQATAGRCTLRADHQGDHVFSPTHLVPDPAPPPPRREGDSATDRLSDEDVAKWADAEDVYDPEVAALAREVQDHRKKARCRCWPGCLVPNANCPVHGAAAPSGEPAEKIPEGQSIFGLCRRRRSHPIHDEAPSAEWVPTMSEYEQHRWSYYCAEHDLHIAPTDSPTADEAVEQHRQSCHPRALPPIPSGDGEPDAEAATADGTECSVHGQQWVTACDACTKARGRHYARTNEPRDVE